MLDEAAALPGDPEDPRSLAERVIAEMKAQPVLIETLRHQFAGHRAHRFGAFGETAEQLQLALETSELAAAATTAKLRLPALAEEKGKPKHRPIPDHVCSATTNLTGTDSQVGRRRRPEGGRSPTGG